MNKLWNSWIFLQAQSWISIKKTATVAIVSALLWWCSIRSWDLTNFQDPRHNQTTNRWVPQENIQETTSLDQAYPWKTAEEVYNIQQIERNVGQTWEAAQIQTEDRIAIPTIKTARAEYEQHCIDTSIKQVTKELSAQFTKRKFQIYANEWYLNQSHQDSALENARNYYNGELLEQLPRINEECAKAACEYWKWELETNQGYMKPGKFWGKINICDQ